MTQGIIRAALVDDAVAIAHVQVRTWRTAYKGMMSDETLANMSVEQSAANWSRGIERGGRICYVASIEDEIVGFAYGAGCRDEDLVSRGFDGEIYALYVLQAHQGVGLGRQLLETSARALHGAGYAGMAIWVLRENTPARGFYEKVGGVYIKEKNINVRGEDLIEVAYGWGNLADFITK